MAWDNTNKIYTTTNGFFSYDMSDPLKPVFRIRKALESGILAQDFDLTTVTIPTLTAKKDTEIADITELQIATLAGTVFDERKTINNTVVKGVVPTQNIAPDLTKTEKEILEANPPVAGTTAIGSQLVIQGSNSNSKYSTYYYDGVEWKQAVEKKEQVDAGSLVTWQDLWDIKAGRYNFVDLTQIADLKNESDITAYSHTTTNKFVLNNLGVAEVNLQSSNTPTSTEIRLLDPNGNLVLNGDIPVLDEYVTTSSLSTYLKKLDDTNSIGVTQKPASFQWSFSDFTPILADHTINGSNTSMTEVNYLKILSDDTKNNWASLFVYKGDYHSGQSGWDSGQSGWGLTGGDFNDRVRPFNKPAPPNPDPTVVVPSFIQSRDPMAVFGLDNRRVKPVTVISATNEWKSDKYFTLDNGIYKFSGVNMIQYSYYPPYEPNNPKDADTLIDTIPGITQLMINGDKLYGATVDSVYVWSPLPTTPTAGYKVATMTTNPTGLAYNSKGTFVICGTIIHWLPPAVTTQSTAKVVLTSSSAIFKTMATETHGVYYVTSDALYLIPADTDYTTIVANTVTPIKIADGFTGITDMNISAAGDIYVSDSKKVYYFAPGVKVATPAKEIVTIGTDFPGDSINQIAILKDGLLLGCSTSGNLERLYGVPTKWAATSVTQAVMPTYAGDTVEVIHSYKNTINKNIEILTSDVVVDIENITNDLKQLQWHIPYYDVVYDKDTRRTVRTPTGVNSPRYVPVSVFMKKNGLNYEIINNPVDLVVERSGLLSSNLGSITSVKFDLISGYSTWSYETNTGKIVMRLV